MANLFGKNKLKELASRLKTTDLEDEIKLIKIWHQDYHKGTLKQDKETSREQAYNQDFFIKILGYKEKPHSPYSFEPKATTEAGDFPDTILGYTDKSKRINNISAVVELKGATIDLDRPQRRAGNMSPVQQGFKYKIQYRDCPFVVVSNFWEFRLYHDNQLDYEKWTLDDLVNPANDYLQFKTFYTLIHSDNLITSKGSSRTENLLSDIRLEQEEIGRKFYQVYRQARLELLRDIYRQNDKVKRNIDVGIEKAQKIIDRIVFACFAEDRGLLPDDTMHRVVLDQTRSAFGGSLWSTFKAFFEAVDVGSEKLGIPDGYNGGLFAHDPELNSLEVGDEPLKSVAELGKYNFDEDLSVNILGHIFEQSISDLEEIKSKVNKSQNLKELQQSRRKKDGIFYTPDYIVRYIVDNSLGAYLHEHEEKVKEEFKLKGNIKDRIYEKREQQAYYKYQDILQNIKVVDPACGSGAFLVYVFDYLLAENRRVASILGNNLFATENYIKSILQNNIYGVDLNEESVEITKLSLWLKTAQKGKKLTDLDNNIKCGNSLIDDPKIVGLRAFNWHNEFPQIFKRGGFDVVIGNPPYVDSENMTKHSPTERSYIAHKFASATGNWDLFIPFVQLSADLLKDGGLCSMIVPNKLLSADYSESIRSYMQDQGSLTNLVDVTKDKVFEVDIYPVIYVFSKSFSYKSIKIIKGLNPSLDSNDVPALEINKNNWAKLFEVQFNIGIPTIPMGALFNVSAAATVGDAYKLKEVIVNDKAAKINRIVNTGTIDPYLALWGWSEMNYLKQRYIHPTFESNTYDTSSKRWLKKDKIIVAGMAVRLEAILSEADMYFPAKSTVVIHETDESFDLRALLALMNAKLWSFIFNRENRHNSMAGGYITVTHKNIAKMPIPKNYNDFVHKLAKLADELSGLLGTLHSKNKRFQLLIGGSFEIQKWPRKLNEWYMLDFNAFIKGLRLQLDMHQRDNLLTLFEQYSLQLIGLQAQCEKLNSKIDEIVYQHYHLTPEEIRMVEEGVDTKI